jgi:hypothetical protein
MIGDIRAPMRLIRGLAPRATSTALRVGLKAWCRPIELQSRERLFLRDTRSLTLGGRQDTEDYRRRSAWRKLSPMSWGSS